MFASQISSLEHYYILLPKLLLLYYQMHSTLQLHALYESFLKNEFCKNTKHTGL